MRNMCNLIFKAREYEKNCLLQIAIMHFTILLSNKIYHIFNVKLEIKLLNKFYFITLDTLCIKDMNIISFWLFFSWHLNNLKVLQGPKIQIWMSMFIIDSKETRLGRCRQKSCSNDSCTGSRKKRVQCIMSVCTAKSVWFESS